MSQLILDLPISEEDVLFHEGKLSIELGNGVRLTTSIPEWVKDIKSTAFVITMEVEGTPPRKDTDAKPGETPVQ